MGGKGKQDKSNQVRIIGGSHRSRLIRFSDGIGLRPTSDRIRETLFNWLQNRVPGSRCLDLFAGSGALGIEALSRGASHVQFIEQATSAAHAISENLCALELEHGSVSRVSAEDWLKQNSGGQAYDLVFLDPPYADNKLEDICAELARSHLVKTGSNIYLENRAELDSNQLPANWQVSREKKAGQVYFYLLTVEEAEHKE